MKPFLLILARDERYVDEKIKELKSLSLPYLIVCGKKLNHPNVVYREPAGKWDAINFGAKLVPEEADVVALNDVDTKIHNLEHALHELERADLVYCRVEVAEGPQVKFYRILNPIRKRLHVAASGELMLMRKEVFKRVLPIPPCLAEDSYILFKALQLGYRARFCEEAYVTTKRTANAEEEVKYKARTTLGIYQALEHVKPPPWIRAFYLTLPIITPMLALAGENGRAWAKGVWKAIRSRRKREQHAKF